MVTYDKDSCTKNLVEEEVMHAIWGILSKAALGFDVYETYSIADAKN
ncbi:MAG: hypothetical protein ACI976_002929 [Aureispira sp.]|jgi:hypothetical protein